MNLDEFDDEVVRQLQHALACAEDCTATLRDLLESPDEDEATPPQVCDPFARVILTSLRQRQLLDTCTLQALLREIEMARKAEEERRAAEAPPEEEVRF